MTEATEFLVWCRGLAETPERLRRLLARAPTAAASGVVASMVRHDRAALSRLAEMVGAPAQPAVTAGDGPEDFAAGRRRLVSMLERVDGSCLHRELLLPSGKALDPWRLAGELAELDVRHLAEIRRFIASG